MTSAADDRLLAPYRAVRRISAGDDGPWPGLLVRLTSGDSCVLVDAHELGPDWPGWAAPLDGHILAPLDIVRRSDGHSAMLPLCVERVDDFLARRASGRLPLAAGEVVTLGVSLIRGYSAASTAGGTGEWWLTDAGRPVLAAGASDRGAAAHTAALLAQLDAASAYPDALAPGLAAIGGTRVSAHDLRDAEDALFAVAVPAPLVTTVLGPRAARDLVAFDRAPTSAPAAEVREGGWVDGLARHIDADLADAFSRATTGVWRRLRSPRSGSRRPWLLATGMAGVIVVAGLLWPTGAGGPATAGTPTGEPLPPAATTVADPAQPAGTAPPVPAELVTVTEMLLEARRRCAGEETCLEGVVVDPAAEIEPGVIDLDPTQRQTTLLDDFGGMAVLRVDSLSGTPEAQLVVVMLHNDRWLLRDVHIAKQP